MPAGESAAAGQGPALERPGHGAAHGLRGAPARRHGCCGFRVSLPHRHHRVGPSAARRAPRASPARARRGNRARCASMQSRSTLPRAPALAADEKFVRALHGRTDGLPLLVADVVDEVSGARPTALDGGAEEPDWNHRALHPAARTGGAGAARGGKRMRRSSGWRPWRACWSATQRRSPSPAPSSRAANGGSATPVGDTPSAIRYTARCFTSALPRSCASSCIAGGRRARGRARRGAQGQRGRAAFHFEQGREPEAALRYYAEAAESALLHSPRGDDEPAERALSLLASVEATSARTTLEITLAALQGAAVVQAVGLASMEAKWAYQRPVAARPGTPAPRCAACSSTGWASSYG